MKTFRRLAHEAHRRSLWQVLSIYLAVSWGVVQVVSALTDSAGLPDWVPPGTLVLLLIGLPIVLATAFVQEGVATPGEGGWRGRPEAHHDAPGVPPAAGRMRHALFTWRNAVYGGMGAFALLGLAIGGYFVMRVSGVGPVASLAAQGMFETREPVVLADFGDNTSDGGLGRMVTEALRMDLVESPALTVLPPAYVHEALGRMGRPAETPLTATLAREVAQREGVKAFIQGDVGSVGSGYVLTASLVDASGNVLAGFRESADSQDRLIQAIEKLSQRIREKAGESLRSIRAGESLQAVTTGSLDALRRYTEATRLSDGGDYAGALVLLESAVELDPEFAMAWRKLGVLLRNQGMDAERQRAAIRQAYELRGRLGPAERALTEAYYFTYGERDQHRAVQAYEQVLELQPDDATALNNLALLYSEQGRLEAAVELLERATRGPGVTATAMGNLAGYYWSLRRDDDAAAAVQRMAERYSGGVRARTMEADLAIGQGRYLDAHAIHGGIAAEAAGNSPARFWAEMGQATSDAGLGRLREARRHFDVAERLAVDAEQGEWLHTALLRRTWMELELARDRATTSALLRRATELALDESLSATFWPASETAALLGLTGEIEEGQRVLDRMSARWPMGERTDLYRMAAAFGRWGVALGARRAEEALDASDEIATLMRCDESRRCWGHYERGSALEALGRDTEAVAEYRKQLGGLAATEMPYLPALGPAVLERLAAAAERTGDTATAVGAWSRLATTWAEPDPELQPRIRHARARLVALGQTQP